MEQEGTLTKKRKTCLDEPVLVLNKLWTPITLTTFRRALIMVYQDAARVVCPKSYTLFDFQGWLVNQPVNGAYVQTVNYRIPLMEVIWLCHYSGVPHRKLAFTKKNLFLRDNFTCQYCQRRLKPEELTIDHIVPRSRGGTTDWENCVAACRRCNRIKGNRLLRETSLRLSRKPVQPKWELTFFVPSHKVKESWKNFLK